MIKSVMQHHAPDYPVFGSGHLPGTAPVVVRKRLPIRAIRMGGPFKVQSRFTAGPVTFMDGYILIDHAGEVRGVEKPDFDKEFVIENGESNTDN